MLRGLAVPHREQGGQLGTFTDPGDYGPDDQRGRYHAPWAASSCMTMTVLLWDHRRPPGRACASAARRDVFVARGSGPERRYCPRRCATRERVAAHRHSRTGRRPPATG